MELMCPHCQRRVTVADEKAGQVASCPLCTKQFMAPALPTAPVPIKPPAPAAPPTDTYAMGPAPAAPKPTWSIDPAPQPEAPPPPPPVPPGEYTRSFSVSLCPKWLAFVPAVCLGAIFVLTFFSWHYGANLYSLSFSFSETGGNFAHLLFYTILTFLCLLAVVPILLFDKGWIFTPPQLVPLMPWKNLALGCILGFCFLLLCFDYARSHFVSGPNPIELGMKLAIRLQLLATLASFGMFWLHWRKRKNLPLPKIEVRW